MFRSLIIIFQVNLPEALEADLRYVEHLCRRAKIALDGTFSLQKQASICLV